MLKYFFSPIEDDLEDSFFEDEWIGFDRMVYPRFLKPSRSFRRRKNPLSSFADNLERKFENRERRGEKPSKLIQKICYFQCQW